MLVRHIGDPVEGPHPMIHHEPHDSILYLSVGPPRPISSHSLRWCKFWTGKTTDEQEAIEILAIQMLEAPNQAFSLFL
jgi:hypothetical protein